jgi:hypothetical protein
LCAVPLFLGPSDHPANTTDHHVYNQRNGQQMHHSPSLHSTLSLPTLIGLELSVSDSDSAPADFFDRLILPSLKDVSIKHKGDSHSPPSATLTALQTRSSVLLEQFALANRTGDTLLPFFHSNTLISRLQLVFCTLELRPLAEAFAQRKFEGDGGAAQFLSNLHTLNLADRWADETPSATWVLATKALIEMVRFRRLSKGI